jgi:LEM3 (ligand-effect modulator 3) family / CDC50 family
MQEDVVEMKIKYDDYYNPQNSVCSIGNEFNANKVCNLTFVVPSNLSPPILIYYELDNFHQNHRSYYQSRDDFQLNGRVGNQDKVSRDRCEPLNVLGNVTLNPCGLTANTFFNDYFQLVSGKDAETGEALTMIETGIAWQSDLEYAFAQPNGFKSDICPTEFNCSDACCDGDDWSCKTPYIDPSDDNACYRYYYPEDDTTQYLYETYPDIISPLEGVTNEHFIVWMRVATQVCLCCCCYCCFW